MPTRTRPIFAIASTPMSGREPCAARPVTSTSRWTKPRCATATLRSVGSVTIAASARELAAICLGADARELLVRDGGHDHVPTQATSLRVYRREHARREAPLHVLRATPVEPSAFDARHERVSHALDADRVHVRVQHQRAATTHAAGHRDDIGAARAKLRERRLESRTLAPLGDEPRESELARAARDDVGIDRLDLDQSSCRARRRRSSRGS